MSARSGARGRRLWTYHEAASFAPGHVPEVPQTLDWERQPSLFRRYEGCDRLTLPPLDRSWLADDVERARVPDLASLAWLLGASSGVSERTAGAHAPLVRRCAPSAGNLHPLETYIVVGGIAGLPDGVYHYDVANHTLERRALAPLPPPAGAPLLLVAVTSILARAAWKYGPRALRSAVLDGGHLAAALEHACLLLGWRATPARLNGRTLVRLLGVARAADRGQTPAERPLFATRCEFGARRAATPSGLRAWSRTLRWQGRVARSERRFVLAPHVQRAWQALGTPTRRVRAIQARGDTRVLGVDERLQLAHDVFARRSARAFEPTALGGAEWRSLGEVLVPRAPGLHVLALVCEGQEPAPGLHVLEPRPAARASLRAALGTHLSWDAAPVSGWLHLTAGNPRGILARLALGQTLAGEAALTLLLLADLAGLDRQPSGYVECLLEAGRRGHAAYLWATRRGLAACGLGGFDDGLAHELLGTVRARWRVLYLLALGKPKAPA
jgi:hypothetical protein